MARLFKKDDKVRISQVGLDKGLDKLQDKNFEGQRITTGLVTQDQVREYVYVKQGEQVALKYKAIDWELDA